MDQRIKKLIRAGLTRRWHTHPHIEQNIAAHQWGVAVALLIQFPDISREALIHALLHDIHEHWFGDIPSPAKDDMYIVIAEASAAQSVQEQLELDLPPLSEVDHARLEWADKAEAYLFLEQYTAYDPFLEIRNRLAVRASDYLERAEQLHAEV